MSDSLLTTTDSPRIAEQRRVPGRSTRMLIFSIVMIAAGVGLNLIAAAVLVERSRACERCHFWIEPGDRHSCEEWA